MPRSEWILSNRSSIILRRSEVHRFGHAACATLRSLFSSFKSSREASLAAATIPSNRLCKSGQSRLWRLLSSHWSRSERLCFGRFGSVTRLSSAGRFASRRSCDVGAASSYNVSGGGAKASSSSSSRDGDGDGETVGCSCTGVRSPPLTLHFSRSAAPSPSSIIISKMLDIARWQTTALGYCPSLVFQKTTSPSASSLDIEIRPLCEIT